MVEVRIKIAVQHSKFTELVKGNIYTWTLDSSLKSPLIHAASPSIPCSSPCFLFFIILYTL